MKTKMKHVFRAVMLAAVVMAAVPVCEGAVGAQTVEAATPRVVLNKKKITIREGQKLTLSVRNASGKVTWKSSNKKIVKVVSASGSKKQKVSLKGLKAGKVTVTAKVGNTKLKAVITVKHVHKYAAATCKGPAKCSCGKTKGRKLKHSWREATCTKPAKCYYCGLVNGEPLGHDYAVATCLKKATCTRCGKTTGTLADHSYTAKGYCRYCNSIELERFVDMRITNTGTESNKVIISISNSGIEPLQICDSDTEGFGMLKEVTRYEDGICEEWEVTRMRLYDQGQAAYVNYVLFPSGSTGNIYFRNAMEYSIGFDYCMEFTFWYGQKKYTAQVNRTMYTYELAK